MSSRDDLPRDPQQDIERMRRLASRDSRSWSGPALVELVLVSLAGLAALLWVVALFLWVPEPVSGPMWLGGGALAGVVLGGPAALVYLVRRGGTRVITQAVR